MEITIENIIHDDNPMIRTTSEQVALPLSAEDEELLRAMHAYVKDSQNPELSQEKNLQPAVGIAAIQVGVPKAMIAVVVPKTEKENWEFALVNPRIVSRSVQKACMEDGEGCLSVPETKEGLVYRSARIKVRAFDLLSGQHIELKASGYLAVVLQHEIDHLTGVLYYDHIDPEDPFKEDPEAVVL
ncbi:MAG: peptide deformylase [Erysipelotrichaceae bacterium]|nr:peptide deformylase [Erysipelotrichaceae bacterium]